MIHKEIKIFGEVQGVGLRHAARTKAAEMGICGFARNESGGSVYAEVEGEREKLEEFLDWLKSNFEITKIESEERTVKNFKDFVIG